MDGVPGSHYLQKLPPGAQRPHGSLGKYSYTLKCPEERPEICVGRITVLLKQAAYYVVPAPGIVAVKAMLPHARVNAAGGFHMCWGSDPAKAFEVAKLAAGWL
jgi:hypothetical protein